MNSTEKARTQLEYVAILCTLNLAGPDMLEREINSGIDEMLAEMRALPVQFRAMTAEVTA